MILSFRDTAGDVLVVDSAAIVAVGLGDPVEGFGQVTLIYTLGGPLAVAAAADEVINAWELADLRAEERAVAHAGLIGWQYHDVVKGTGG